MPLTLEQYNSVPDIHSDFRNELWFANIPDDKGEAANGLLLKNTRITPPAVTIGQVRVPLYNFPRAYAGHRDIGNTFSADFYEDVKGGTGRTLLAWQQRCVDPLLDDRKSQLEYSARCELRVIDTVGALVNSFLLVNVWPMVVTLPDSNGETTTPSIITVQFSVDFFDMAAIAALAR